ncbi:MAG: hypothetical protein JJT81_09885, partial [Rubellimicrobium sp.]|nr:hypothetical protein [Rubellimicrobium sp.]
MRPADSLATHRGLAALFAAPLRLGLAAHDPHDLPSLLTQYQETLGSSFNCNTQSPKGVGC